MKKVLGLDLGTNSIGWGLIERCDGTEIGKEYLGIGRILDAGVRIIPMGQDVLGKFNSGTSVSQTANRTKCRSARRLYERHHLRRERLHRVLNVLGFLPEHYVAQIDFKKRLGQFIDDKEPKLAYDFNGRFIFKKSFEEMLGDFRLHQPQLLENKRGEPALVPYDWTIYYLRKKALTRRIEKEELAWIILNFNQKRGYYQLRGEDEEKNDVKEYVQLLKIVSVEKDEKDKKNDKKMWYRMTLENGWEYRQAFTVEPQLLNTEKEFFVTEELDKNGNIKIVKNKKTDTDGEEKRRIMPLPSFDEINLMDKEQQNKFYKKIKARTEITISNSGKTVGTYIYETLLKNPSQKIRGKLVRTIERKFYKEELIAILKKQTELQPELFPEDLYNDSVRELYRYNEAHQDVLSGRNSYVHLFVNDIIFYQRPLKSQKSSIRNCHLEYRKYKDENGNEIKEYLKTIPKSNPLYQEFRLWQWLFNLKIYKKDDDTDVTEQLIANIADMEILFDFLSNRKEIGQNELLKHFKLSNRTHRWNFVEDKVYPCNETGTQIRTRMSKVINVPTGFLTKENEQKLWHIIYSVTDKNEYEKALKTFAIKHNLDKSSFVENFKKFPPFKSEYGSFSEKAIKKLLPLMRLGKYWNESCITDTITDRVNSIKERLQAVNYDETEVGKAADDDIQKHILKSFCGVVDFTQGLKLHQASYLIYGRHSEPINADKWNSVADLEKYLEEFKQHDLRNPIVEQVVMETLRVVRDVWKKYGDFSEIHIELGREMKNTAEERKRLTNSIAENEKTNLRIKALIMELKEFSDGENVRPYSPIQQEALKIYEEYAVSNIEEDDTEKEFVQKISKTAQPSRSELQRYKLWLEQKYKSPYTGQMIPLGKLFTDEYQIEHIIPQSRYFDDSLSNKVICEATVNQLKGKQLGFEFIKNHHGEIVETGFGKSVIILDESNYEIFVKKHYATNHAKRTKLLLEDIPDKMIERQLNDTRYISKFISRLLSNIVRDDTGDDGVNSKNLIPVNGKITAVLKQDWGLNDIWNTLILSRFERMNKLTGTVNFTSKNQEGHTIPTMPLELSENFQKKRIDHRHHAMDALIIACATRDHVNLLNNQSAKSETTRYDLQNKLRNKEKKTYFDRANNKQITKNVFTKFKKAWDSFSVDTRNALEKIVVSFKQNLRIINKAMNRYESYKDENGNIRIGKKGKPQKGILKQEGVNWAIRKPLHKDTVFAQVSLRKIKKVKLSEALKDWKMIVSTELKQEIKRLIANCGGEFKADAISKHFKDRKYLFNNANISKIDIYYFETENAAVRKSLDSSFTKERIEKSVTDIVIQKILLNHLSAKADKPEIAFSPEGIEEMNKNIVRLNNGKHHQPIYKVRVYESIGNKFQVGTARNKKDKYVEAAKGTNLFFAVYVDENGNRSYETIPLNIAIERLKHGLKEVPETNENGHSLLFHLSPNDLVYVPTEDEKENIHTINWESLSKDHISRIYKFTDSSGVQANFIPSSIATVLFDCNKDIQKEMGIDYPIQNEIGVGSRGSKNQNALTGEIIKEVCIKLKTDRLGKIKPV